MIETNNLTFLKQNFPFTYSSLLNKKSSIVEKSAITLIQTKSGDTTLQVQRNGHPQLIHSKYDPRKEAERFVEQYKDEVANYEHVLFYGVGLGYHIDEFMGRYPQLNFSLYEPNHEVFNQFIHHFNINNLPTSRLMNIFIENSRAEGELFLKELTQNIQERILIVVLPSYQQVFKEEYNQFVESFKSAVNSKRQAIYVDNMFSERWTLNSLINFPKSIQTPNILDNEFKSRFKNKPLIIVSAGPSLEDDYEYLRNIKEKGLAYIFAVGSANRALVAQGIMPDAVCTYDPQGHNHRVFSSLIEKGITNIPMIFGTSVGFETLDWYQGPKLHMVTSQDTVAQYYLKNYDNSPIEIIEDSPTIAAVTFQLAARLGCNPIIFAGQNLGFKNDLYYAKDVEYKQKNRSVEVVDEDRITVTLVDDVYGNKIETTPSFNNMREYIEYQIDRYPNIEVINTTKGGASIKGTVFKPIEELMEQILTNPVVDENWNLGIDNKYDEQYTLECITKMERSIESFRQQYWEIQDILTEVKKNVSLRKEKKLEKLTLQFDKLMKKLLVNECYLCYIQPVNRSHFQALSIKAANVRKQRNEMDRAVLLIDAFVPFLEQCKQTFEQVIGSIYKVHQEVRQLSIVHPYKSYPSDCGVFQYVGDWERSNSSTGETADYCIKQMATKGPSSIQFRIRGSALRLLGSFVNVGSNRITVKINGLAQKIVSIKDIRKEPTETPNGNQILFETQNLVDKEHLIEIIIPDSTNFLFSGVEVSREARAYHLEEVMNIEQLQIGKRIRCHYKASYNKVGEFGGLGEETKGFIPPESSAYPDGDFYFIMVDEIDGEKKLIADRNIQHSISWNSIFNGISSNTFLSQCGEMIEQPLRILMPTGGTSEGDNNNEWDKYIVNDKNKNNWNADIGIGSWTSSKIEGFKERRMRRGEQTVKQYKNSTYSEVTSLLAGIGFRPMILIKLKS